MSDLPTTPDPDDADAEQLADALVELAKRPGVLRLVALQMAGLLPPPGRISERQIARGMGLSRRKVRQIGALGLMAFESDPDLLRQLRSIHDHL